MKTITMGIRGNLCQAHPIGKYDTKHVADIFVQKKYGCACVTSRKILYKEVTLFQQWEGQALAAKQSAIPTSRRRPLFIVVFLWYLYLLLYIHKNLLAFCSGSPAPWISILVWMPITFETDNNAIVYALERIISYARKNQYIFLAQNVWWIASIIGLQQSLIIYIDNLRERSEAYQAPSINQYDRDNIHPDRISRIKKPIPELDSPNYCSSRDSGESESKQLSTSEDSLHDQILDNCDEPRQQSKQQREKVARRTLQMIKEISGRFPQRKKPRKSYKDQATGIDRSELACRQAAGECQCCAWPGDRWGAHKTLDHFRWLRKEKGTAPFPKAKRNQQL